MKGWGIRTIVTIGLMATMTGTVACQNSMSGQMNRSLYERLGGYNAISAVVDDFAGRLFRDEKLAAFFGGWSGDRQARFKQLNVLLVCNATGGPCTYLGRTMPMSHAGMMINDAQFNQVAGHLVTTLDKFKVPQPERDELLNIVGGLRPQIVGK